MFESTGVLAIDIHCHYNHGSPHDTEADMKLYNPTLEYLKRVYDQLGIAVSCCSTFAGVISAEDVVEENEYAFQKAREIDWLYQWVVIDPRRDETFQQAYRMLKTEKCVGIKLHPPYHGYSILDYGDKVFSFASENRAIVQIHPETQALHLLTFADRYPNMKLIIAHLGSVEHVEAICQAKHKNVYVDTSGVASSKNAVIEYAVSRAGSEHILFGTDTYSAAFQRGRIEGALISKEDKINILQKNALRLLGSKISLPL
ncbi:MAG TPA: amidohydrolase [Clostridiaceae bacterium]|nr:amidohydrolase [Clostridiaceae bacterium]